MATTLYGSNLDMLGQADIADRDQNLRERTANQNFLAQLADARTRRRATEANYDVGLRGQETARLASQRALEASLADVMGRQNVADVTSGRQLEAALAGQNASKYNADVYANASRYGADSSANTSRYGSDVAANTARYGADTRYNTDMEQFRRARARDELLAEIDREKMKRDWDRSVLDDSTRRYGILSDFDTNVMRLDRAREHDNTLSSLDQAKMQLQRDIAALEDATERQRIEANKMIGLRGDGNLGMSDELLVNLMDRDKQASDYYNRNVDLARLAQDQGRIGFWDGLTDVQATYFGNPAKYQAEKGLKALRDLNIDTSGIWANPAKNYRIEAKPRDTRFGDWINRGTTTGLTPSTRGARNVLSFDQLAEQVGVGYDNP